MTEFRDRTFVRDRLVLDGHEFLDCTFRQCLLVYGAEAETDLRGCKLEENTQLLMHDRAMLPFRLLYHLYHSGMKDYVEDLFEKVRPAATRNKSGGRSGEPAPRMRIPP